MANNIFISYSKVDSDFAIKLADDLVLSGFSVWIDREIQVGKSWQETIERRLKEASEVIVILSPSAMKSKWVQHEGALAYGWNKPLFPILIEEISELPPWLEQYQYINFANKPYKFAFTNLLNILTPPNPIQDLLKQQVDAYRSTGQLIGNAILQVFEENIDSLVIDEETEELIQKSMRRSSFVERYETLAIYLDNLLDKNKPTIFISYSREDYESASMIYCHLKDAGYKPWMDKEDILPGDDWERKIQQMIRQSDFLIVCLSSNSISKRGYIQKEIKMALDTAKEIPPGSIYLIPVRLEECNIPDDLSQYHYVDLFKPGGLERIVLAIDVEWYQRNS